MVGPNHATDFTAAFDGLANKASRPPTSAPAEHARSVARSAASAPTSGEWPGPYDGLRHPLKVTSLPLDSPWYVHAREQDRGSKSHRGKPGYARAVPRQRYAGRQHHLM